MRRKLLNALAAGLAIAGLGLALTASPANASTVYGCQDGWVCFYADDNYGGGRYGFHVQNLYGNTCWSFPWSGQPGWPGGATANEISSMIFNRAGTVANPQHYLHIYDDNYCTPSAGVGTVSFGLINQTQYTPSLTNYVGPQWNDRIGSVSYS